VSVIGLSLITLVVWGVTPLLEKSALERTAPLTAVTIRACVMAVAYVGIAIATGTGAVLFQVDGRSFLYILISSILGGVLGLLTYFHALKAGDAAAVVPITACYPLVTTLLATVFLQEPISLSRIFGAALIVTGIYLVR